MIEVSVTIPMFQTKHIGWLVLESLARQAGMNFEWELIIAEEEEYSPMGWDEIKKYEFWLKEVGCKRIEYIPLKEWIPLGSKVMVMIGACSQESTVWINADADQYIPHLFLETARREILNNEWADAFKTPKWMLYNILNGNSGLKDLTDFHERFDMPMFVLPMHIAKKIDITGQVNYGPQVYKSIKIRTGKLDVLMDETDNWKYGLNAIGLHSCTASKPCGGYDPPFFPPPIEVEKNIPLDVMERLRDCKEHAQNHPKPGLYTELWAEWKKIHGEPNLHK